MCNIVPKISFQARFLSPVNSKTRKSVTICNHDCSMESFHSQHTQKMKLFKNSSHIPEIDTYKYIQCRFHKSEQTGFPPDNHLHVYNSPVPDLRH